jgi:predicted amidohydrolase
VALAQIPIEALDPDANLELVLRSCARAAEQGAQLLLFPELADLGQVPSFDERFVVRYLEAAQPLSGPFVKSIGQAAHRYALHIVIGVAERHPTVGATVYNSAVVLGPSGEVLGVQRKLHPAGEERHVFARGPSIEVVQTDLGILTAQICYDIYFPEVARTAALRGAEILCGVANITLRQEWPDRLQQLAAVRAYENMQHVAVVNRVGQNHGREFGGGSVVAEPPGHILAVAAEGEEALLVTTLRGSTLTEERAKRPVFSDRRPDVYELGDHLAHP